jgi:hypothetical protein
MKNDRKGLERIQSEKYCGDFSESWRGKIPKYNRKEYHLLDFILARFPGWVRGAQKIGSCVSWGGTLAVDILLCEAYKLKGMIVDALVAKEPTYGACRVEALGRKRGSWSDGATAYGQMKSLVEMGVILKKDLSSITGNSWHDYRRHSSKKCKAEGYYGAGGELDRGKIDEIMTERPIRYYSKINNVEEYAIAIQNGYPVSICSGLGFNMNRDADGFGYRQGSWAHCMLGTGVRYFKNKINGMISNSWGHSAGGPMPGVKHSSIKKCSWWVTERDLQSMLNARGAYAFSDVGGLTKRRLDWSDVFDLN